MRHVLLIAAALFVVVWVVESSPGVAPPSTTPAPRVRPRQWARSAQTASIDPVSLANVLLTAVPESLRQIAATNLPEASRILWSEFLDGKKPTWFTGLPSDVQSYLVIEFGPSTAASAATTTSASTSASSPPSSAPSGSRTAVIISSSTGTLLSIPTSVADSGISYTDKIGIGLGIPLAFFVIATIILSVCLIRQRRRRRRPDPRHVNSRPPTPAFLGSTLSPTYPTRGGASAWPLRGDDGLENTYPDPRLVSAPGTTLHQKKSSHLSSNSLSSVPEEEKEHGYGHEYFGPSLSQAERSSIIERKHQFMVTTAPVHPLHQDRGSDGGNFGAPTIARKPVPTSTRNPYGNYSSASSGRQPATDTSLPDPQADYPPSHRRGGGPLGGFGNKFSQYWKPQRPGSDRYTKVHDGA